MIRTIMGRCVIATALLASATAAHAQTSASAYTYGTRYDAMGRVTGTIAPDSDGTTGPLKHAATRTTYDAAGRPVKVETGELSSWKSEAVAPANWGTAFAVLSSIEITYDALGRKIIERAKGSNGAIVGVIQYSYDNMGRLQCTTVRMNPAVWGSLPASACTLGAQGSEGPDRITKNVYDAAGQLLQVRKAVGTSIEVAEATYTYTLNGKIKYVIDANGNRAELRYDGHDRQNRWVFPSKTRPTSYNDTTPATALSSSGSLNEGDYEAYTYDANGNRLTLRKRDGSTISYQYDALNRMTRKTIPNRADLASVHERDVFYSYDLRGLQTLARFDSASGVGLTTTYDDFGRPLSSRSNLDGLDKTLTYQHDANGNRTRITHFDNQYFQTDYDGLDRPKAFRQNSTILGSTTYNQRGLPALRSWTYAAASANRDTWSYDPAGRLNALGIDLHGTASDVSWNFTRNPASQILTETRNNDTYAWDGHVNLTRAYTTNGLNQYTAAGSAAFCYDANGNLTADGSSVYKYDVENRLVERRAQTNTTCTALSYTGALQADLRYDPLGRLYSITGLSGTIRYLYDDDARIAEFSGTHALLRRYVHGPDAGADDPLIWYEGSAVNSTARRYLHSDARGSIVAVTNYQGTSVATNTYDEYGIPSASNQGAFQYTGQAWLDELGMYYYKARIYSPTLGRFLQTDPVGYEDQINLYAYVANDPVNGTDPTGMQVAAPRPWFGSGPWTRQRSLQKLPSATSRDLLLAGTATSNAATDASTKGQTVAAATATVDALAAAADQINTETSYGSLPKSAKIVGKNLGAAGTAASAMFSYSERRAEGATSSEAFAGAASETAVGGAFTATGAVGGAIVGAVPGAILGGAMGAAVDYVTGVSESAGDAAQEAAREPVRTNNFCRICHD